MSFKNHAKLLQIWQMRKFFRENFVLRGYFKVLLRCRGNIGLKET